MSEQICKQKRVVAVLSSRLPGSRQGTGVSRGRPQDRGNNGRNESPSSLAMGARPKWQNGFTRANKLAMREVQYFPLMFTGGFFSSTAGWEERIDKGGGIDARTF